MSFSEDANYEKIDMARYALANAMKDFIDSNISDYIFNQALVSELGNVPVDDVFAHFPAFATQVESALSTTNIPGIPYDFSTYQNIKNALIRDGITYHPEFCVPNMDSVQLGQMPLLSSGCDIAESNADYDSSSDQVAAWHIVSKTLGELKNTTTPIKVFEVEVFESGIPFLSLTLNSRSKITHNHTASPWPGVQGNEPWTSNDNIYIRGLKIDTRFEKSGASQVALNAYHYYSGPSGTSWSARWNILGPNQTGNIFVDDYYSIVDVPKKHIGSWRGINWLFSTFVPIQWSTIQVPAMMWNTYERDWWEGKKYIASVNGRDITGKMTFDNETFFYKREDAHQSSYWFMDSDASYRIWNNHPNQTNMNGGHHSEMNVEKR